MHTLITFLGKGRLDPTTGYQKARYRFSDGSEHETPFFGLALMRHLDPERLVILGTSGSMWPVLVEHVVADEDEEGRIALIEASEREDVDQALLTRIRPLVEKGIGRSCELRLIPYGRHDTDYEEILRAMADSVPRGQVSIDLTHSFRHLAALGMLAAFFMERVARCDVAGIYYGALEMAPMGEAKPVLRLDNLLAVERWINALDRYDQTGNYSVFVRPLIDAGVSEDKARCLEEAAFHERIFNLSDARRKLLTFLPVLDSGLAGAGAFFCRQLAARLEWVRRDGLFEHQRRLAYEYLKRCDYVRAVVFAWEAMVTRECQRGNGDLLAFEQRRQAAERIEAGIRGAGEDWEKQAFFRLKNLRNALAHGIPPEREDWRRIQQNEERLRTTLEADIKRLLG